MIREKLGGLPGSEHVGTKLNARDLVVGHSFDSRPPLGIEQRLVGEPVRNELLGNGRTIHELCEPVRKRGLATTRKADRALKSADVLLFRRHTPVFYTNQFVAVNNPVCVTDESSTRTVVSMDHARAKRQEKRAPKPSSVRAAVPGPDGKTLGQRVNEAMAYKSGIQKAQYLPSDLKRDVARIMQIPQADIDAKLQQRLSAITTGKVSESPISAAIAAACGVNPLWLCYGWGKMLG